MLRSKDPMTYEDGYHWLQGHLIDHFDALLDLMQSESEPRMRSKFVELIGDSQLPKAIPFLENELQHTDREVRVWAYNSLMYFENTKAVAIAEEFKKQNPHEDFTY